MPEEIKEDETPQEEAANETDSIEKGEKTDAEEKPVETKKKSGKKKWIFIFLIIAVLLGISGLGWEYMPERFSFLFKKDFDYTETSINDDNLSEEAISPFFIPPESESKTIRIDLSIVWDALASVRFRKNEPVIRNMMYEKFYEMSRQHPDLNEQKTELDNEISSMLRKTLGVQNLKVRIKEIRYF